MNEKQEITKFEGMWEGPYPYKGQPRTLRMVFAGNVYNGYVDGKISYAGIFIYDDKSITITWAKEYQKYGKQTTFQYTIVSNTLTIGVGKDIHILEKK
jgi:hypothetical protein